MKNVQTAKDDFLIAAEKVIKNANKVYGYDVVTVTDHDEIFVTDGKVAIQKNGAYGLAAGRYNLLKIAKVGYTFQPVEDGKKSPDVNRIFNEGKEIILNSHSWTYISQPFGILAQRFEDEENFWSYGPDYLQLLTPIITFHRFLFRGRSGIAIAQNEEYTIALMAVRCSKERDKAAFNFPLVEAKTEVVIEAKPETVAAKIEAKPAPVVIEKPKAPARSPFAL